MDTTTQIEIEKKQAGEVINPFPGLRPFAVSESHLFFGREGQAEEVLLKLSGHKFVAIVGPSGSGKSSFVYCGVIPLLLGGFLPQEKDDWEVITTRPGGGPINNLSKALTKNALERSEFADDEVEKIKEAYFNSTLQSSSRGIIEIVEQTKEFQDKNVLILVDQFEELFRFRRNDADALNESLAFVNLLMEAVETKDTPIFVAITMRSDFVGECAFFPNLTKSINDSYYMIPQMTRDQKRSVIEGPVLVAGGKISPRLVQQLLNDVGDNPDQLPILQHALMRTFDYWVNYKQGSEEMDIHHYDAIGRMAEALSRHADEAYDELDEEQKFVCEKVFKSLTEKGGGERGMAIRRPSSVGELIAVTDASKEDIFLVIEKFREKGRSLLMPPYAISLDDKSIIDISHESLMRIWIRLRNWVDDEGESVQMYLRLADAALAYQVGKSALWRPPDLQVALNWKEKNKPTLAWAERYNPAFERTMVFLDYSKQEYEIEQKIKEEQQKKQLRRARITALFLGSATVVSIGFLVYAITQTVEADRQAQIANNQKKIAQNNADEAKNNADEAKKAEDKAKQNAEEARRQEQKALESAKEAERQKNNAVQSAQEAKRQEEKAIENFEQAERERERAEQESERADKKAEEANTQRMIAESNEKNAYDLRLRSIAQSMAVKSLQITNPRVKALHAQQAYKFHTEHGGKDYHPDIYAALYYATKVFLGKEFNHLKGKEEGQKHEDAVRAVVSSKSSGSIFTTGSDGNIFEWDKKLKFKRKLVSDAYIKQSMVLSSDGSLLVVVGDAPYISYYNLNEENPSKKELPESLSTVYDIAFNYNDSQIIFTASDRKIYKAGASKNAVISEVGSSTYKITALNTFPNENIAMIGNSNGEIIFFDIDSPQQKPYTTLKHTASIYSLAVSPDGKLLVAGDVYGNLVLWKKDNKGNFQKDAVLEGHTARISEIKFSHNKKLMATASYDGTVRLWEVGKWNNQPIVMDDHKDWVWSIAFTQDDKYLISGSRDNLVLKYPTNPDFMKDILCEQMTNREFDNFSELEWERYVADDVKYEYTCESLPKQKDE